MSFMSRSGISVMIASLWLCAVGSPLAAQEQAEAVKAEATTFSTLLSFDNTDGGNPEAGLIQGTDGNFYGTASTGGAHSNGSVFKITPSGTLTTLYSFCALSACSDGADPLGGLVEGTDGNFYGTTELGTIFKLTPTGTLTTLHTFDGTDGENPAAALVLGTDGNLYGTASRGGANARCKLRTSYYESCGTVFKISLTGTFTTLASFSMATGFHPSSPLIQATNGNFYGTTPEGGTGNFGTVFEVTPTGMLTVLHNFDATDGEKSLGALVQGTDGNFYGTTSFGGGNAAFGGTIFKITPTGTLTTLHSFDDSDGSEASAALIQATDGNFYGTTSEFGSSSDGTVFQITPSGTLTTLHTFDQTDGQQPFSALLQATNGEFYGTTSIGANTACSEGCGTIFGLSVGLGAFVVPQPSSGTSGEAVRILGTNLTGATSVTFNGTAAVFKIASSSEITTTVPAGATSGEVKVVTPSGTLSSNVSFIVP